jgi:hypothetical protein
MVSVQVIESTSAQTLPHTPIYLRVAMWSRVWAEGYRKGDKNV